MKKFNEQEMGFISHLSAGIHAEKGYNPKLVFPENILKVSKTILD